MINYLNFLIMKKIFLALILLFHFSHFTAQNINLKEIKKEIENPSSQYNLEKILFKYKGLPIQLDSIEARYLYYGIKSTVDLKKSEELRTQFKKEDLKKSLELGEAMLSDNPTDLETISVVMECYYRQQDSSTKLNHYSNQFRKLVDAMLSSGDGKSEKTAFLVNSVSDEYILLAILRKNTYQMKRTSKPSKEGMYDIWDDNGSKTYINVIYDMKF